MKLEELKSLCEKATPGPWEKSDDNCIYGPKVDLGEENEAIWGDRFKHTQIVETDSGFYPPGDNDAEFIVAARSELPRLVEIVERALPWLKLCYDKIPTANTNGKPQPQLEQLIKDIEGV